MNNFKQQRAGASLHKLTNSLVRWIDTEAKLDGNVELSATQKVNLVRCLPFILIHVACLAVFWVGWSPVAVIACAGLFFIRMFSITAFYHRYFSHRSFKTNRFWQFVFAVMGNSAAQRGPLWWASHHRNHHKHSDEENDIHSPSQHGFWWSHVGWFMSEKGFRTDHESVRDYAKYPELRWLNRLDSVVPLFLAVVVLIAGDWMARSWPELGTSGAQMLVWGFCISTVLLFHATFTINSLGHVWGTRRFQTKDDSRNNPWLALLTLGEGWHNNHHRYPVSTRQGFYWWEVDITYGVLRILERFGIVWQLNQVPQRVLEEGRAGNTTGGGVDLRGAL